MNKQIKSQERYNIFGNKLLTITTLITYKLLAIAKNKIMYIIHIEGIKGHVSNFKVPL